MKYLTKLLIMSILLSTQLLGMDVVEKRAKHESAPRTSLRLTNPTKEQMIEAGQSPTITHVTLRDSEIFIRPEWFKPWNNLTYLELKGITGTAQILKNNQFPNLETLRIGSAHQMELTLGEGIQAVLEHSQNLRVIRFISGGQFGTSEGPNFDSLGWIIERTHGWVDTSYQFEEFMCPQIFVSKVFEFTKNPTDEIRNRPRYYNWQGPGPSALPLNMSGDGAILLGKYDV